MSALPIADVTQWDTSTNGNGTDREGSQKGSTGSLLERVTADLEAFKRETPEERAARRAQWEVERIQLWRPHCEECDRDLDPGEPIY